MCIAIYKPQDKLISKETLEQCFKSNPDGAGFMYVDNKKLKINKGFFTFAEFWEAFEPIQNLKSVIHFRIKTHGAVELENCHPFNVTPNLGFVHNGIISGFGSATVSDTREFNKHIMQPLVQKWGKLALFQEPIQDLLESRISYSKLIFLDNNNKEVIFNEDKGIWDDEVWYSNSSYKIKEIVPYVYDPKYEKQKELPVYAGYPNYYAKPKPKQVLQEGESVFLLGAHWDNVTRVLHPKGSIWEVIAINSDYTIDLSNEFDTTFIYSVPYFKVDFYDWTVDEFDTQTRLVKDTSIEYGYHVPPSTKDLGVY